MVSASISEDMLVVLDRSGLLAGIEGSAVSSSRSELGLKPKVDCLRGMAGMRISRTSTRRKVEDALLVEVRGGDLLYSASCPVYNALSPWHVLIAKKPVLRWSLGVFGWWMVKYMQPCQCRLSPPITEGSPLHHRRIPPYPATSCQSAWVSWICKWDHRYGCMVLAF